MGASELAAETLLDGRVAREQGLDVAHQVAEVWPGHVPHVVRPAGQVGDLEHVHGAKVVLAIEDGLLESHIEEHFGRDEREALRNDNLQGEALILSSSSHHLNIDEK